MKLNLGVREGYREGFLNVDVKDYAGGGIDEVIPSFTKLPYGDNPFTYVLFEYVLESLPVGEVEDAIKEACRVCSGEVVMRVGSHFLGLPTGLLGYPIFSIASFLRLDKEKRKDLNPWLCRDIKHPEYFCICDVKVELNARNRWLFRRVEAWINKSRKHQIFWERMFLGRLFTPRCLVIHLRKRRLGDG